MCKVTMFIAISSKFLWASFYHRYVRNDQRVSPQDPRPREEDHTVYWLVSGLNTNGDVESHPPEKKILTSTMLFGECSILGGRIL